MKNILHEYYSGVLQRIRSEVEILNKLIPHNVTKGTANEESFKNIVKNFIPNSLSVGSGIIFDSFGNFSKQVDLIIYDKNIYPNLFGQTYQVFFPVETVLAAIEIKTHLNKNNLFDVFENCKSIRKLRHYTDKITNNKPSEEFPINIIEFPTRPPSTHLIAFRVDSYKFSNWKDRYFSCQDTESIVDVSLLLDIATVFQFTNPDKRTKNDLEYGFYALRESDITPDSSSMDYFCFDEGDKTEIINGSKYKSAKFSINNRYPILMPERAFLSFILRLNRTLEVWPRHLSFDPTKYLDSNYTKFNFF